MAYQNCQKAIKAQDDFIRECEEVRLEQDIPKDALSQKAFGNRTSYYYFANHRRNMTATSMNKLAKALGKKLVICLVEAGE